MEANQAILMQIDYDYKQNWWFYHIKDEDLSKTRHFIPFLVSPKWMWVGHKVSFKSLTKNKVYSCSDSLVSFPEYNLFYCNSFGFYDMPYHVISCRT